MEDVCFKGGIMKAAYYNQYGNPDVIEIKDIEKPIMKEHEVLVRVHASSINYADYATLTGSPFVIRFTNGLFRPKKKILGMDYSGIIEAIGSKVTKFDIGDHVFGELSMEGMGAYAEYKCIDEKLLVKKSEKLSHEIAATLPLAGVTALQGIRDHGKVKSGSKVLVNGASSGVGSFAVQIAKDYGAEVTVLCHTEKLDAMASIGADHTIDYTKESVLNLKGSYDLIYDCATYQPAKNFEHLLSEKGIYIANGGAMKHLFKVMIFGKMMSKKDGITYTNYLAKFSTSDLAYLNTMVEEERLSPLIYMNYTIDDIAEAMKMYKSRESYGKITVSI